MLKKIQEEKYNNQIEMAKMKKQIENEYKESLEKFKQQAQVDAERSKRIRDNWYRYIGD